MTSELKRPTIKKPELKKPMSVYDMTYVCGRNKYMIGDFVSEMFKESGLTIEELATMIKREPKEVKRWLENSMYITINTLSLLIFAMKGEFFKIETIDKIKDK